MLRPPLWKRKLTHYRNNSKVQRKILGLYRPRPTSTAPEVGCQTVPARDKIPRSPNHSIGGTAMKKQGTSDAKNSLLASCTGICDLHH
jgi:hypothetical protein